MFTTKKITTFTTMAKGRKDSEILSFRMRKELVTRIKQAAKSKRQSLHVYFLSQIDDKSELAQIVKEVEEQRELKIVKVATAIIDYVTDLSEIKAKSNLSDSEFNDVIIESLRQSSKDRNNS